MAPFGHLSVTKQTMDPAHDIHRNRWWSQRKAHYFFLGVGFLPLPCPTLAWKVLRGAESFAFVVCLLGGGGSPSHYPHRPGMLVASSRGWSWACPPPSPPL